MCPTQMAKYDVTISDFTAGVQLAKTSVTHNYGDGSAFNITLTFFPIIKEERTYYVILSVTSFNFASLQSFASFSMSMLVPGVGKSVFMVISICRYIASNYARNFQYHIWLVKNKSIFVLSWILV